VAEVYTPPPVVAEVYTPPPAHTLQSASIDLVGINFDGGWF